MSRPEKKVPRGARARKSKKVVRWAKTSRREAARADRRNHPAAAGGSWIWPATRLATYHRDGFCCVYCRAAAEDGVELSVDHVTPWELGGGNGPENTLTACLSCNASKRDLPLAEWLRSLRDRGVDTTGVAARVRASLARKLDRAEGRRLVALRRGA